MALQMNDRLDNLRVAASNRDASMMHMNAVNACARWCGPKTNHTQVTEFVQRQIASLDGLNDSLSNEVRESWQWLAGELASMPVIAPEPTRSVPAFGSVLAFGMRRDRAKGFAHQGRIRIAA